MKKEDVEFTSEYSLTINRNDTVHALIAWFDTPFENLENPQNLSTSPYKKSTHWKQVVFYLDHPFIVERDDVIYGSIAVRKSKSNFRELDIKISYHCESRQ
jgi:protein arginine N-methyltransferase 1